LFTSPCFSPLLLTSAHSSSLIITHPHFTLRNNASSASNLPHLRSSSLLFVLALCSNRT
jgi:hypothetical protein